MHFTKTSAAVQDCWVIAHLYEQQIFIGAIAVTQGYCEPDLQSSTEQWGVHFALTSAAVQGCWVTAHLYEQLHPPVQSKPILLTNLLLEAGELI